MEVSDVVLVVAVEVSVVIDTVVPEVSDDVKLKVVAEVLEDMVVLDVSEVVLAVAVDVCVFVDTVELKVTVAELNVKLAVEDPVDVVKLSQRSSQLS